MDINDNLQYLLLANTFKLIGSNMPLKRLYRLVGNRKKRNHISVSDVEVSRGLWLIINILRYQQENNLQKLSILEIGTGWTHFYGIFVKIFINCELVLFDVVDNRNFESIKSRCANLHNYLMKSHIAELERLPNYQDRLKVLHQVSTLSSVEELYKILNLKYIVSEKGDLSNFSDNDFDLIFSIDVLEHVNRDQISIFIKNQYTVLKTHGIVFHQIGIDDHLVHYLPHLSHKQYLYYSTKKITMLYKNSIQYTNRLQMTDFVKLFTDAKFFVLTADKDLDNKVRLDRIHPDNKIYGQDDLLATRGYLICEKRE
jgi:hypothetical protein